MGDNKMQNNIMLQRAKSAALSRDFTLAVRLYSELVRSDPNNQDLLTQLADLYVKSGKDEQALPVYKTIISLNSDNVNALNAMGAIYRRQKKYEESIAVLEQALITDEKNVQIYYNLGFTYKLMGKYEDAIQCFETVVERNPNDVLAFNHLGSIFQTTNNNLKAVTTFQRGLKIDPNHPILHLNLAKSYEQLGKIDNAISEYEAALRSKPGWIDAIDGYADLLLKKNRTGDAGEIVKQALRLNPNNVKMLSKLGNVYARQSNYDDAEVQFNNALSVDPENEKALSGLADVYEASGKNSDAIRVMQQVENKKPEDSGVLKQFSHVLLSASRYNSASQKIKKVYDMNPDDVQTLNLLGQYYICSGEEAKAENCYRKIEEINPAYTEHYLDGAGRFKQIGQLLKSEKYCQKYIQSNPRSPDAYSMLAENYEELGNYDKALENFRKSSELDEDNVKYRHGVDRVTSKVVASEKIPVHADDLPSAGSADDSVAPADDFDLNADFADTAHTEIQMGQDDSVFEEPEQSSAASVDDGTENLFTKKYDDEFSFESLTEPDTNPEDVLDTRFLDEEITPDEIEDAPASLDNLVEEADPLEQAEDDFFDKGRSGAGGYYGGEGGYADGNDGEGSDSFGFEDEDIKSDNPSGGHGVTELHDGADEEAYADETEAGGFADEDVNGTEPAQEDDGLDDLFTERRNDRRDLDNLKDELEDLKSEYGFGGQEEDFVPRPAHQINPLREPKQEVEQALMPEGETLLEEKTDELPLPDDRIAEPGELNLGDHLFDEAEEPETPLSEPEAVLEEPEAVLEEPEAVLEEPEAVLEEPEPAAEENKNIPSLSDDLPDLENLSGEDEDFDQLFSNSSGTVPEENELEAEEDGDIASVGADHVTDLVHETTEPEPEEFYVEPAPGGEEEAEPLTEEEPLPQEDAADLEPEVVPEVQSVEEAAGIEDLAEVEELSDSDGLMSDASVVEPAVEPGDEENVYDGADKTLVSGGQDNAEDRVILPSLSEIIDGIEDKNTSHKFNSLLQLFVRLKDLIQFLPEDKKTIFVSSRNYVLLDYIIQKLSGKPGLLATAQALRQAWHIEENDSVEITPQMKNEMLSYMRTLVRKLPDQDIAISLDEEIKKTMDRLN